MTRQIGWIALGLSVLGGLYGCSRKQATASHAQGSEYETLELRYQGNNGTVSPAELAESLGYLAPLHLNFVGSTISGPASVQGS